MCPFFPPLCVCRSLQAVSDPGEGRKKLVQPNLGNWYWAKTSESDVSCCFFAIFEYSTILEKSFQIKVTTALGVQESLRHVSIETLYTGYMWLYP